MPSEAAGRVEGALRIVEPRIRAFHAAIADAEREVADEIARRASADDVNAEQALAQLGPFAIGRIDPERFARLLGVGGAPLTPEAIDVLGRADAILKGLGPDLARHVVRVEAGGDVRDAVKDALAGFGRAYGAARAVELARAGIFDEARHGHLLGPLPFRLWNRAERHLAPPLVVSVRGDDCLPAGLGEFLDGDLVLVLVVAGPTTPAPLARLVTPGTYVVQTADPAALDRVVETGHPAVALLFDEERPGQAWFVHDPDRGATTWERLSVQRMPSEADVGPGRRAPVWLEELEHLRALAERPPAPSPNGSDGAAVRLDTGAVAVGRRGVDGSGTVGAAAASRDTAPDPADRLAAWLLARTDLSDA